MIAQPLRGGQESWWGVGAIQLSYYGMPQRELQLVKILEEQTHYYLYYSFVYLTISYQPNYYDCPA